VAKFSGFDDHRDQRRKEQVFSRSEGGSRKLAVGSWQSAVGSLEFEAWRLDGLLTLTRFDQKSGDRREGRDGQTKKGRALNKALPLRRIMQLYPPIVIPPTSFVDNDFPPLFS
jgi:hypothetical protein